MACEPLISTARTDHERLIDCTFVCRHRPTDGVPVIVYGTYLERCRFEDAGLKRNKLHLARQDAARCRE